MRKGDKKSIWFWFNLRKFNWKVCFTIIWVIYIDEWCTDPSNQYAPWLIIQLLLERKIDYCKLFKSNAEGNEFSRTKVERISYVSFFGYFYKTVPEIKTDIFFAFPSQNFIHFFTIPDLIKKNFINFMNNKPDNLS